MIMENQENDKLRLGNFSISKPKKWNKNNVKLEISDYDYEYIGNILKTN